MPPDLTDRIEPLLNALDRADSFAGLDLPGGRLHALKGDREGVAHSNCLGTGVSSFASKTATLMKCEVVDTTRPSHRRH